MKTAARTRRYAPSGQTVGMFRLIEAYIKLHYPDKIVLVVTTETKERLARLVEAEVTNEWTAIGNLNMFAQACDLPRGPTTTWGFAFHTGIAYNLNN